VTTNLAHLLDDAPADRVAIIDGSTRVTYAELQAQVARTAGGLVAAGLGSGDRICLLAGNEPSFIVGLLGAWHAGCTVVLLNHQDPVPQLTQYLEAVNPDALLCGASRQSIGVANDLAAAGFGTKLVATPSGVAGDIASVDADPIPIAAVEDEDPALLIFTSGVSGLPRPAVLTHRNLRATQDAVVASDDMQLNEGAVSLAALPMVHILGLNVAVLSTLRNRGTTVLQSHWNAEQALGLIDEHAIDTLVLVPAMWADLADAPGASPAALANVKLARCGAATLTPDVTGKVHDQLGIELAQGYGLTETAGTITFEPNARSRPGSVGTPLDHVELRIIDEDGLVDAEPGDPGEIWVRGDCVFGGYWGADELNADLFTDDGWYRTGDIAVYDDRVYLVGRSKDMISVSGFKISPVEVELCLESHPAVSGALVIGEADDRTGERVVAYVVANNGDTVDEDDLTDHVRDELARYKVPKSVWVVDDLPANVIGKRIRRKLN
jgi:acyl-CoA synthetase (AMP-forming)/AMP-acid ligase II